MIYPHSKRRDLGARAGHFIKSIHEAPDAKMLDIGDHLGFSTPSVSITLDREIITPVLDEIAMFIAPFVPLR